MRPPRILHVGAPLALNGGALLRDWPIAWRSWGRLDADGGNAVLVCHALTSDCHVTSAGEEGTPPGWWESIVGPGRAIDTNRFFVLCANVLGGSDGSAGPSSPEPGTGRPWGMRFPQVTVADMVQAQTVLLQHLGIRRLRLVVGGCLGGMQALLWGVRHAAMVDAVVAISVRLASSAYSIALWDVVRRAIRQDPAWCSGDYYGGALPGDGVALASAIGLLHWMDPALMERRYGRRRREGGGPAGQAPLFEIEHMLEGVVARAAAGAGRIDPNSLLLLTRAIDLFDLDDGAGGIAGATEPLPRHLVVSYARDLRYPPEEGERLTQALRKAGAKAKHRTLSGQVAHGGFLLEPAPVGALIQEFVGP